MPPIAVLATQRAAGDRAFSFDHEAMLGNEALQGSAIPLRYVYLSELPQASRPSWLDALSYLSRLERMKLERFTVQGRDSRIRRSLEALANITTLRLTPQELSWIAEDIEAEDQSF